MNRLPLDPSLEESKFPLVKRVVKPIIGKYSKWSVGEVVLAARYGRRYHIRKRKMCGTLVPLIQSCCNVPESHLENV